MKQIFKYAMALLMLVAVVSCGRDDAPAGKDEVNGNNTKDYVLSNDGKTLLAWVNRETTSINMENNPELRNVKIIGERVFSEHKNLVKIVFPKNLERIENKAFERTKLSSIVIPNEVKSIGNDAFNGSKLTSISFGNSVTSIGNSAFAYNQLTTVDIPNSVKSIGMYAFSVNNLTSVNIGNGLTNINDFVFTINKLTSINIPNNIINIGGEAFSHNQLTSINIGNSVQNIGERAFEFNPLVSLSIEATEPPKLHNSTLWSNISSIYVPRESVDKYKQADIWKRYTSHIQAKQ
ncbi:MAG: leucine-rich repeat domain-containing protein [Flavobacteriaceae bacterium]|nr:leucine-rich repeat domain-containing protein [Flavobacteriaceae bacterium]